MNRKRGELPGFEKIQELYFQSQLFSLREYYRNLSGEEEFKATLSSVTRKHTYPNLFDIDHFVLKDAALQTAITRDLTDFVSFIESNFYINIGTVRAKFVLSKHSAQPIFSGATDCYFQFKTPFFHAHTKPSASSSRKNMMAMNAPADRWVNATAKGSRKTVSTSKIRNKMP